MDRKGKKTYRLSAGSTRLSSSLWRLDSRRLERSSSTLRRMSCVVGDDRDGEEAGSLPELLAGRSDGVAIGEGCAIADKRAVRHIPGGEAVVVAQEGEEGCFSGRASRSQINWEGATYTPGTMEMFSACRIWSRRYLVSCLLPTWRRPPTALASGAPDGLGRVCFQTSVTTSSFSALVDRFLIFHSLSL